MKWQWRRSLVAVLAGNLIYFAAWRYWPPRAQHQVGRIDLGLAIDFVICVACYALARLIPWI